MLVQVYTAQSPEEAEALVAAGVDHVGVTVSHRGLPGEVGLDVGREVVAAVRRGQARCVALTVDTDVAAIVEFADALRPDILHLCGDTEALGPDAVADIRRRLSAPQPELMQAIGVTGPEAVATAEAFAPQVDWLLLDSVTDAVEGIGASGHAHDWSVSRRMVEAVEIPVILAGGLAADNVAAAIEAVRPAGVDSLSRTNRPLPQGGFVKDLDAVRRFVDEARSAARGVR